MNLQKTICLNINKLMKNKKITIEHLSSLTNIKTTRLKTILNKDIKKRITIDEIHRISKSLNIPINILFNPLN